MENQHKSKNFKAWLDKLQQESWQLELLISGFALFGLFQAFQYFELLNIESQIDKNKPLIILTGITLTACSILGFTLLLHVILRGLWIGALGLRYVSGDIDYKKLNYSSKFDTYLWKKVGSFDKYISKLENYCSIIFAIAFLLVFYVIAFFSTAIVFSLISYIYNKTENLFFQYSLISLSILLVIGMLLTFVDFVTQGFLKRKKILSAIYFPFYRVFSIITFSFLYRPLVYNFIDNKLGKQISYILAPAFLFIMYFSSTGNLRSNYIDKSNNSTRFYSNPQNYEDALLDEKDFIKKASISSKVIKSNYLSLFITFDESIEEDIYQFNKTLKPENDSRGFYSNMLTHSPDKSLNKDSLQNAYLKTLKSIHHITIDSTAYINLDFVFTQNKKKQLGFESFINIQNLAPGKHVLKIERHRKNKDTTYLSKIVTIPFWYYNK
ncbi:hypothetical protein [Algibacter sp. L3A6]|uniref:hypothetical protein n=1 Tax=Algibacter sp. L3A6 TaxID=2686366 RepID=UPI00131C5BB4|nr:hypothetical protein [Algibacter sp. L3A6]